MDCPRTTWFATSIVSDRALDEFVIEGITTTIPLHQRIFAEKVSRRFDEMHAITGGEWFDGW